MAAPPRRPATGSVYAALIEKMFLDRYSEGVTRIAFERTDIEAAAAALGLPLPRNLGDVIYSFRSRRGLPASILETQPPGRQWQIEGAGIGRYAFTLAWDRRISPNPDLAAIKIPDATPEIVSKHAVTDEQALLAKVRYNRLVDVFLGIAAYSLQSHLRTTVTGVGQIEIDEIYVGVDRHGRQYVVPVQAKGGADRLSAVQARQDIACCRERYPSLICRPMSAQFMGGDRIVLFELTLQDDELRILEEKHYLLAPADEITDEDLAAYSARPLA